MVNERLESDRSSGWPGEELIVGISSSSSSSSSRSTGRGWRKEELGEEGLLYSYRAATPLEEGEGGGGNSVCGSG